jgi:hypothetical protein
VVTCPTCLPSTRTAGVANAGGRLVIGNLVLSEW